MEFPQVDLPVDMIAWTEVTEDILNIYKQSCRLKACIFALCIEGSITVSINLMDTEIKQGDFITPASRNYHTVLRTKGKSVPGIRGVFFPLPQWSQPHPVYIKLLLLTYWSIRVLAVNPTVASYFKDYFALWARITTGPYPPDTKMAQSTLNMLLSGIDRMYCHRPQMQKGNKSRKRKYAANWCSSSSKLYRERRAHSMPTNWASPCNTSAPP